MARKTRYYYDEITCTFKEEKLTPGSFAKKVSTIGIISLALAFGIFQAYLHTSGDPIVNNQKRQNSQLRAALTELNERNYELMAQVDALHEKDNELYRSVFGMDEIDEGIYEGGIGGAEDFDPNAGPGVVNNAKKNIARLASKIREQANSYQDIASELENNKEKLSHIPAIRPVPGGLISGFGMRMHPILRIRKMHTGIDMEARMGTPVHATGDGVVKFAGAKANGYGTHIDVDHGYGFVTKYAHLSKIAIKNGQKVKRGELIGYSGNTGQSAGPHLHYEVVKEGRKVDPMNHLIRGVTPEEFLRMKKAAQVENKSWD
jgi:murein DD-endopeptidase MepM/ murein hydrolase activator NlpD